MVLQASTPEGTAGDDRACALVRAPRSIRGRLAEIVSDDPPDIALERAAGVA